LKESQQPISRRTISRLFRVAKVKILAISINICFPLPAVPGG